MITDKEREEIETFLDYFDFEKTQKAMFSTEWRWASVQGVVEVYDLRRAARRLLTEAFERLTPENPEVFTGTGGFYVTGKLYPGDTKKYVSLYFAIATWDNYA